MITQLGGIRLVNWTENNAKCFIRGFCLVNIALLFYKSYVQFNSIGDYDLPEYNYIERVQEDLPRKTTITEYQNIINSRNIFGQKIYVDGANNTLPIRLVGVCTQPVCTDLYGKKIDFAILEDLRNNLQDVFEPQTEVFDIGFLHRIETDRVEIINNGRVYKIYLGEGLSDTQKKVIDIEEEIKKDRNGKGVKEIKFRHYEIERKAFESTIENLSSLLGTARHKVIPQGILIYGISKDSLFKDLGIYDNDIITKINGVDIKSKLGAIEMYEKLYIMDPSDIGTVTITINRAGLEIPLRYTLSE